MSKVKSFWRSLLKSPVAALKFTSEARYALPFFTFALMGRELYPPYNENEENGTVIIILGFGVSSGIFAPLRSLIGLQFGTKVIIVGSKWGAWGIDFLMKKAREEFLRACEWSKKNKTPLILIGYSFGCEAVLRLNLEHYRDITHCFLISPPVQAPLLALCPGLLLLPTAREILFNNLFLSKPEYYQKENITTLIGERDGLAMVSRDWFPEEADIFSLPFCHGEMILNADSRKKIIELMTGHFRSVEYC